VLFAEFTARLPKWHSKIPSSSGGVGVVELPEGMTAPSCFQSVDSRPPWTVSVDEDRS
jgi:hypothetical protein